jgi:hypothetical protein
MTDVKDFLSRNPDIESEFRDFAAQYETLRDVWKVCPVWYWMLDLIDRCHYRNVEKLERYIDRQSERIQDVSDAAMEATRLRHFNYKPGARQIQAEEEAGSISPAEARRRRFIWARIVAYEASDFIFRDKIDRVRFNNACAPIINAEMGIELALKDETEVCRSVLRQQADELREILGNPFQFAGSNDFCNGDFASNAFQSTNLKSGAC